jgi:hypothetical protein
MRYAVLCGLLLLFPGAASASADTYYVDSATGADNASGRRQEDAWRTLGRVNAARLKAGDRVLFRRDQVWSGELRISASGQPDAPIVFTAYGSGAPPVIEGGNHGIYSERQHDVKIVGLHIRDTKSSAILVRNGRRFQLRDLKIERTGGRDDGGGISWWHGDELSISACTLEGVRGDAIWIWQAARVKIQNNRIMVVTGPNGDNAHLQHLRDFDISGNTFSMDGPTDSGKGNVLLGNSDEGRIAGNTLIAGNYGIGIDASNTVVEDNHFIKHDKASWSAALNMGAGRSRNLTIRRNYFDGARVGLSLFELTGEWADAPVVRANMTIAENVFNVRQQALAVDGPVQYSGAFVNNIIVGKPARDWVRDGGRILSEGWDVSGTRFVSVPPRWHARQPCDAIARRSSPARSDANRSGAAAADSCSGL